MKYKFAEKNVELREVLAIWACSEKGEKINTDAINVKMTTAVDAGRSRLIRREMKSVNDIDELFWYSLSREVIIT
jgi:hypothetical protein